jgi:hypothetical protein
MRKEMPLASSLRKIQCAIADAADRYFLLDAAAKYLHSMASSKPAKRRVLSNLMFAFSLVRCVANLLTS